MNSEMNYDNHTLFVKCDCATADQITTSFREALMTYQRKIGKSINCRFRVNLVENREGKSFGIAFVFLTNPEIYYMLLRKNPDGSDRIEYIDDPSHVRPDAGKLTNESGWTFAEDASWSDVQKRDSECPKVPIQLDPLITLPPFELTSDQIEFKRQKIIQENQGKDGFAPSLVDIPKHAHFCIDRAIARPVDPKYMSNILKCKDIPIWVTRDDLKAQFLPYASDSTTIQERYIKGCKVEETYPFVNINRDRVGFVIFDPSTHDAQFALHMMKKTVISKRMPNGQTMTVTLIFNHSYRTDRDTMTDINQRPHIRLMTAKVGNRRR